MKTLIPLIAALGITGEAFRRAVKSAIAAYRAKKSVGNIIADSVEAVVDNESK